MPLFDDLRSRLRRKPARAPTTPDVAPRGVAPRGVDSREKLHAFWRNPGGKNRPEDYLEPTGRSRFLVDFISPYVGTDGRILEIGCNVGRNLAHLYDAGYRDLTAIEISADALAMLRATFPDLGATARLINAPVEDVIRDFPDGSFDLVYAMAVLEHIHPDSEWIFDEMVRISRSAIVTIEDERGSSSHHVPRDYGTVFQARGAHQVVERSVSADEGFPVDFEARVFKVGPTGS
jgi:SAM-dependent methyltransferase